MYSNSVVAYKFPGCGDGIVTLTGPKGSFGVPGYRGNVDCGWKIQVHPSKVSHL